MVLCFISWDNFYFSVSCRLRALQASPTATILLYFPQVRALQSLACFMLVSDTQAQLHGPVLGRCLRAPLNSGQQMVQLQDSHSCESSVPGGGSAGVGAHA